MGLETTAVLFSEIDNIRVCYSLCACVYVCNSEFEKNASGLLGELYETDQEKSHKLLTRKLQTWKKKHYYYYYYYYERTYLNSRKTAGCCKIY